MFEAHIYFSKNLAVDSGLMLKNLFYEPSQKRSVGLQLGKRKAKLPQVILLCVNHMANLLNLHFICFLDFEQSLLIMLPSLFLSVSGNFPLYRLFKGSHINQSINRISVPDSLIISVAEQEELMIGQSLSPLFG